MKLNKKRIIDDFFTAMIGFVIILILSSPIIFVIITYMFQEAFFVIKVFPVAQFHEFSPMVFTGKIANSLITLIVFALILHFFNFVKNIILYVKSHYLD